MITQINPPLALVTPLGDALAHFIYGDSQDVVWCCFQLETGECWWWRNHEIRYAPSITGQNPVISPIQLKPANEDALARHRQRYRKKEKSK
jgi:hypothetical protein